MSSQTNNIDIAGIFVSFLNNNLKDIPFHKYEKNFTFIVNGKRYETNRVVADILSPIIRNYHYQDESINEFEIKTIKSNQKNIKDPSKEPDYFLDFLNLVNFDQINVDFSHQEYYLYYLQQLGCSLDSIKIDSKFTEELTKENSVQRLKTIQLFFPDHSQDEKSVYYQIIQFIALNFDEISKEELKTLDIITLEDIFRNEHFCIQSEDSLLEFILDLYKQDHSNAPLFEYVHFKFTSDETRNNFLESFSIDDINSNILRSIFNSFCKDEKNNNNQRYFSKDIQCLMIGIDDAGKTKILYKMKRDEVVETISTIGFNCETINHNDFECTIWDVGGNNRIRSLWKHYFGVNDAIIFVVDSSNSNRMDEARDELKKLLNVDELKDSPLLVFANKCDLQNAMSENEITNRLDLNSINDRPWSLQMSSALTGYGLKEGLEFICKQVKLKRKNIKSINTKRPKTA